jgi:hypothetical protein
MADEAFFQWQNPVLRDAIYPRREMKLGDFLIYYKEIDLWAQYKNANVAALQGEYVAAQQKAVTEAYGNYRARGDYFLKPDVRADFARLGTLDEGELAKINTLHSTFASSFKYKDVRKEKNFVSDRIYEWELHRNEAQRLVKAKERRISIMQEQVPPHPNIPKEQVELEKLRAALAMAQEELTRLYSFLSSFEKIEKRKLALFNAQNDAQRSKAMLAPRLTDLNDQIGQAKRKATDPQKIAPIEADAAKLQAQIRTLDETINTPEAAYVTKYTPSAPLSARDVVAWKLEEYSKQVRSKTHDQLLAEIVQRFKSEPKRFPLWLQYMVIHFSGMRYASAHGSWADPKDLLFGLRTASLAKDLKTLNEGAIAGLCEQARAQYSAPAPGVTVPALARATDPEWKQKVAFHLKSLSSPSPSTRLNALVNLRLDEQNYAIEAMKIEDALEELKSYKDKLPAWMWKEVSALTQLRTTEVKAKDWDKLTSQEEQSRWAADDANFRQMLDQWKTADITGWREEHARSSDLIVTRAVCNEVAEHIQHLRGYQPPGGLTPKAPWYLKNETENKLLGSPRPYFKKPAAAADYPPGASILWLRFWEKEPSPWQAAHLIQTKTGDGLLPAEFLRGKAAPAASGAWQYAMTDPITRTRLVTGEKGSKVKQTQYLRWIHEATVAEAAETAEGWVVLTFETALPYEDRRVSAVGIFKHYLPELLTDGSEETYNRSFVGFVPEGQVPLVDLKNMLDWNKVLWQPGPAKTDTTPKPIPTRPGM